MREAARFQKPVASVSPRTSAQDAAVQMREEALGCLVVVDEAQRPIGILTDRDLALRVVADGRRATATDVASVMSRPLVTAEATDTIEAVIARMRRSGIRRVPVVRDRRLVGIVSLDDLVVHLGHELHGFAEAIRRQFSDARAEGGVDGLLQEIRDCLAPIDDPLACDRAGTGA